jgi:hypothetical protein
MNPTSSISAAEQLLTWVVKALYENDVELFAHTVLRLVRLRHRHRRVRGDDAPVANPADPQGPFAVSRKDQVGDLLIFVPRSLESYLIDEATGRYGYSHVAVDCGEVDQATGKPVITESTTGVGVHRSFLDKYGSRPFVRVPLSQAGVERDSFRDCVQEQLGEPYDTLDALTWGDVRDPAKQICTGLAGDCLPENLRRDIAREGQAGRLGRRSVSVHRRLGRKRGVFISPNAFAEYFGAPPGKEISDTDEPIIPRGVGQAGEQQDNDPRARQRFWPALLVGIALAGGLWIYWLSRRKESDG